MKLEIQVTTTECHPHFGGENTIVKSFRDIERAGKYYESKIDDSPYSHTSISIIQKLEDYL